MRMISYRAILCLSFGLLAFGGTASPAATTQCLNGLRPALMAGGFSGSVDCRHDLLKVRHVGKVRAFGRTFSVYSYRYQLAPVCRECAFHGGQRIIFMERGRYIGQYRSDFVRATIRHGSLVFMPEDASERPSTLKFTRRGPPDRFWADGEELSFFR